MLVYTKCLRAIYFLSQILMARGLYNQVHLQVLFNQPAPSYCPRVQCFYLGLPNYISIYNLLHPINIMSSMMRTQVDKQGYLLYQRIPILPINAVYLREIFPNMVIVTIMPTRVKSCSCPVAQTAPWKSNLPVTGAKSSPLNYHCLLKLALL